MKRRIWLLTALLAFLWATPARADNRFIVRTTLGSAGLQNFCLVNLCTVGPVLDGTLGQLFLLTTPSTVNATTFLALLQSTPGIVAAELDQLLSLIGGLNNVITPPSGLSDTTPVNYFGASVWNGYANQPAAGIVRAQEAQNTFGVTGASIVADIDTGVDPNHPALQPVLLQGYDFTRNQAGGSEMNDLTSLPPPSGTTSVAIVNQSTAAVVDQSTAAVVDGTPYAAFGHGTMVLGVIHLVAPKVQLLPLKAFHSDGTGYLSDILRGVYYAVQNGANVINMSFDFITPSNEMQLAMTYADQHNVVSVASAGNDGKQEIVYPAALTSTVMGVASTSDLDTRSSFSNYGDAIVWVAAPGEAIVTTYPFSSYAAGWGTSFSAPFVSGTAALLLNHLGSINQALAAAAVAHAKWIGPDMGNGRLDIVQAMQGLPSSSTPDFALSAAPPGATSFAGQTASFVVTAAPSGGFNLPVTWSCSSAAPASACTVSPSSVTLDGKNPANVTVIVQTTAHSVLPPGAQPPTETPLGPWGLLTTGFAWVLLGVLLRKWKGASRLRLGPAICAGLLFLVAALCVSCGGSSTPPPGNTGTPQGNYTVTVTGTSGSTSHSASYRLTVN